VGVLGVVGTVDVANRQSVTNNGRDGATAVVRRVLEVARDVPYTSLTQAGFATQAQTRALDLQTATSGTWALKRSGFTYTITANICAVDDPADGTNVHGTQDPPFCSSGTASATPDDQPDDYRRVTATVTWDVGGTNRTLTEAALIGARGSQNLPSVTNVAAASGTATSPVTSALTSSLTFDVTTINNPAAVSWLVDDDVKGSCPPATSTCTGSANLWHFTWTLGTPTTDTNSSSINYQKCIAPPVAGGYVYDGTYQVGARAFDSDGVAGPRGSTPYTINRCAAIPPPNLNATGRDTATTVVDTEWTKNPEGDTLGYRVYKGTSWATRSLVSCYGVTGSWITDVTSCIDPSPPVSTGSWFYYVVAIDRDPAGNPREGAVSTMPVNTGNKDPKTPGTPSGVVNPDGSVSLTWSVAPGNPDTDDGVVDSYRIYRRAATATGTPTYVNRYDYDTSTQLCNGTSTCTWTDSSTGGAQHVYTITAVDPHLRESPYTGNLVK
jgi:hypothetical protein